MKKYFYNFFLNLIQLESNIAFYPSLISLGGLVFAFFMYYMESWGISKYLVENAPLLVIDNVETARSLLTTLIGGLISLMVFSFSLVMILLNQASSNFSPRLLPGLISNRRHQIILGIYNSSLLYCIFTLVSITPHGDSYQVPGFSVLLGIFLMTVCLAAFIYFIHSISQAIQVGTVMDKILNKATSRLSAMIKNENDKNINFPYTESWKMIHSKKTGYLQNFNLKSIAEFADKHNIKIEIIQIKGTFVLGKTPLLKYNPDVLKDEDIEKLLENFIFSKNELVEENYVLAFKQVTEIALKAMSPGINDPGTAINAIDYMTELFELRMQKRDESYFFNDNNIVVLKIKTVNFDQLIYQVMAALRNYCKHDIVVIQKLFMMLEYLWLKADTCDEGYKESIRNEINHLYKDALSNQHNEADLKVINQLMDKIR